MLLCRYKVIQNKDVYNEVTNKPAMMSYTLLAKFSLLPYLKTNFRVYQKKWSPSFGFPK
jgi:hypothetical protein